MTSRVLSSLRKNIKIGDSLNCMYYNSVDKRYYGSFFTVTVVEIGTDNYKPVRDFVGKTEDGRLVTLWRMEIKGNNA